MLSSVQTKSLALRDITGILCVAKPVLGTGNMHPASCRHSNNACIFLLDMFVPFRPLIVTCRLVTQCCLASKEIYPTRRSVSLGTRRSFHTYTSSHTGAQWCNVCLHPKWIVCTSYVWSTFPFRHPVQTSISSLVICLGPLTSC